MPKLRHSCATADCQQRVAQKDLFCPTCHFRQIDRQRYLIGLLTVEYRGLTAPDQSALHRLLEAAVLAGPLFRRMLEEWLASNVKGDQK